MKRSVVFKLSKGYHGRSKNNYRIAAGKVCDERKSLWPDGSQVDKALTNAFADRKVRKRTNRAIWIQQINAATRQFSTDSTISFFSIRIVLSKL